jgi:Ca-activated chloride channel homolog
VLAAFDLAFLLLLAYLWLTARRARRSGPIAYLEPADGAAPGALGARLRRALPPLLWLLALGALLLALARPQASLLLPARMEAVVLALDMSGSMRATDIAPERMTAARNAAKAFIDKQPQHARVGVVGVAAAAAVVQSPTRNREDLVQAIDRLEPQRGTALGSGLIIALDTLMPEAKIDVEQFISPRPGAAPPPRPIEPGADEKKAPGSARSAAIVLLSDGVSNVGPDPLKAAEVAADHGVRIYTVGIGTPEGATVSADGWKARVRLDEATLQRVATMTGGQYFRAADAAQLTAIYRELGTRIGFERRQPTELTALAVALGALLATLGALLSLAWFNRIL